MKTSSNFSKPIGNNEIESREKKDLLQTVGGGNRGSAIKLANSSFAQVKNRNKAQNEDMMDYE
jgi:hypothetical protein